MHWACDLVLSSLSFSCLKTQVSETDLQISSKKLSEGEPQRTQKNDEGLLKHSACFLFVFGVLEEWHLISWGKFYRGI